MIGAVFDPASLSGVKERVEAAVLAKLRAGDVKFSVHFSDGKTRSGIMNRRLAAIQTRQDRNPWYPNANTMRELRALALDLVSRVNARRARAEDLVKEIILRGIGENVVAQQNPDGSSFRQLTARYAAMKARKYGAGLPILRATGEMLGGLYVKVTRTLR